MDQEAQGGDKKLLQEIDPLKAQSEVSAFDRGADISPMDPPEAYDPPARKKIARPAMNPFVADLFDEHVVFKAHLQAFKLALEELRAAGSMGPSHGAVIKNFFSFFGDTFIEHNRNEERFLFPILREKLILSGEHGPGKSPMTGIDVLENEHIEALQLATISLKYFELYGRLPDEKSQEIVFQLGINHGLELVELMDLHIFREDEIIFGLAHELLNEQELEALSKHSFT